MALRRNTFPGAAEGLAREWHPLQARRQWHYRISRGRIMGGISVEGQRRHALAECEAVDVAPERVNPAPALMPWGPGRERIGKPRSALPHRQVRGTHAASFETDAYIVRTGVR
jgi:hypothetical protein